MGPVDPVASTSHNMAMETLVPTRVLLLSGEPGSGKTTASLRLVDMARAAGMLVGGVLAPMLYDSDGESACIQGLHIRTGAKHIIALSGDLDATGILRDRFSVAQGRFRLDPAALRWALRVTLDDLRADLDLVLIDEIGPLELERNLGFAPALDCLPLARARAVVLIVRSRLADHLRERLGPLCACTVMLSTENRGRVPSRLLRDVLPAPTRGGLGERP